MSTPGITPLENLPPERKRITARLLLQGFSRWEIEEMLNAFAHELAEQIRGWAAVQVGGEIEEIYGYAADLIDPEADDYVGPVRPGEEPTT